MKYLVTDAAWKEKGREKIYSFNFKNMSKVTNKKYVNWEIKFRVISLLPDHFLLPLIIIPLGGCM